MPKPKQDEALAKKRTGTTRTVAESRDERLKRLAAQQKPKPQQKLVQGFTAAGRTSEKTGGPSGGRRPGIATRNPKRA